MSRIVLAPCSPFSVTPGLMKDAAALARSTRACTCTRISPRTSTRRPTAAKIYGMRPVEFAELGRLARADDVWFAHAIFLDDRRDRALRRDRHRHGPLPLGQHALRAGHRQDPARCSTRASTVGLGVDGSASNDTSNMFLEARLAQMLQRVAPARYLSETPGGRGGFGGSPKALSAREAL